jgi:hypothetical protein
MCSLESSHQNCLLPPNKSRDLSTISTCGRLYKTTRSWGLHRIIIHLVSSTSGRWDTYMCQVTASSLAGLLRMWSLLLTLPFFPFALFQVSQAVPFGEYILAPASRVLRPRSVFNVNGSVTSAEGLLHPDGSPTTISGAKSSVTYDFGLNVAGRIRFTVRGNIAAAGEVLGLTYSESSLWVNSLGSDSTGNVDVSQIRGTQSP